MQNEWENARSKSEQTMIWKLACGFSHFSATIFVFYGKMRPFSWHTIGDIMLFRSFVFHTRFFRVITCSLPSILWSTKWSFFFSFYQFQMRIRVDSFFSLRTFRALSFGEAKQNETIRSIELCVYVCQAFQFNCSLMLSDVRIPILIKAPFIGSM